MDIIKREEGICYAMMYKCFWFVMYLVILLDGGGFKAHTTFFVLFLSLLYISNAVRTKGYLFVEKRKTVFWQSLILAGGILSVFMGIDRGESIYGFFRMIAILIAGIAFQQMEDGQKTFFFKTIPIMGLMLMAGCLFQKFPFFEEWVSLSGRINGSFKYSNTMALFLLLGIISAEHLFGRGKRVVQVILALGVLGTGSRTAFVILCGYLLFVFIKYKGKNKYVLLIFAGFIGLVWLITALGGNLYSINRFLKLSINASTFQGRLLYWEDAVRMLFKRPFGLGYMGYFYLQQAEQTGVYSVRFVHNEWLQWILDYGVLAGMGLGGYLIQGCRQNEISALKKELLGLIAIYCFFDFHLQFFSIIIIVLLLLPRANIIWKCDWDVKKNGIWKYGSMICLSISACLCASAGIAEYYADREAYGQAVKWNPLSAQYKQECLLQSKDLDTADAYADQLLEENQYLYAAYLIKSNAAAQNGSLDGFIENRKRALCLRKYKIKEYEDYFEVLLGWYLGAYEGKNMQEREKCLEAMKEIQELITMTKKEISLRAYRIQEKPDLTFNKEYLNLIKELEENIDE